MFLAWDRKINFLANFCDISGLFILLFSVLYLWLFIADSVLQLKLASGRCYAPVYTPEHLAPGKQRSMRHSRSAVYVAARRRTSRMKSVIRIRLRLCLTEATGSSEFLITNANLSLFIYLFRFVVKDDKIWTMYFTNERSFSDVW